MANLVLELGFRRLVRHVDAAAADVVLPAVVDAPQPPFFIAAEEQRGASVGAVVGQEADLAAGRPKRDEILAQHAHACGHAIPVRELSGQEGGQSVLAE